MYPDLVEHNGRSAMKLQIERWKAAIRDRIMLCSEQKRTVLVSE